MYTCIYMYLYTYVSKVQWYINIFRYTCINKCIYIFVYIGVCHVFSYKLA